MNLHAFANLLGGTVEHGAVRLTDGTGRVVALGPEQGRVYEDAAAYDRWHRDGDDSGLIDAVEWGRHVAHWTWVRQVARLLFAETHHTGGGLHVILFGRADGKLVVFHEEGGMLFDSWESRERKHAAGDDEVGDDGIAWHDFTDGE